MPERKISQGGVVIDGAAPAVARAEALQAVRAGTRFRVRARVNVTAGEGGPWYTPGDAPPTKKCAPPITRYINNHIASRGIRDYVHRGKWHARRDSNPQPPDSKSGTLSIELRA